MRQTAARCCQESAEASHTLFRLIGGPAVLSGKQLLQFLFQERCKFRKFWFLEILDLYFASVLRGLGSSPLAS